ncbi:hypothetical protein RBS60_08755 [Sinomonas sp. ASV486]|uniref:Uncharacterized protein n=1 Tax=Sinomonas puerhi TaxID=3238584 RepID=A0AB39L610_9MICC|nr:hypothetical protein [Sinomonas sp. ASV486]MDQ4490288.1 hypothetical protein [Sinomonas sp. ASV486]
MAIPDSGTLSPGTSAHEDGGPVFVDASGRKLRLMRLIGGVALLLVAGYLVTIGIALMTGGPNAAAPFLPAAAVPSPTVTAQTPDGRPSAATPSPSAADNAPGSAPLTVANYVTQATAPAGTARVPVGASTQAASAPTAAPAPTATPISAQGNPSAPGQDKRTIPTQPTHP